MDVRLIGCDDVFNLDLVRKAKIFPDRLPVAAAMFFGSGRSTGFCR